MITKVESAAFVRRLSFPPEIECAFQASYYAAEAHGGEVYIEGHADGTTGSSPFSTAQGDYPTVLAEGFRTAFVTACPLEVLPEETPQLPDEKLPIFDNSVHAAEEQPLLHSLPAQ